VDAMNRVPTIPNLVCEPNRGTHETCPFPGVDREETPAAESVLTRKECDTPR